MRNNLFERNCIFTGTTGEMTAKWEHLRKLYNLDSNDDTDYKMLQKLSEQHINNLKKMKVSMAAQIFSRRVAALLKGLARLASNEDMPSEASETAEFILFMNKCFDSLNGVKVNNSNEENYLRCAVDEDSPHMAFWIEAIKTLQSVKFIKSNSTKYVPPSVKNYIHTLKGFRYLWPKLKDDGFKFLSIRNFNQDPLENYFGSIRSHGVRNINPTCQSFINSFKALLINNFLSTHSPGSNCENDEAVALDSLRDFFSKSRDEILPLLQVPDLSIPDQLPQNNPPLISRANILGFYKLELEKLSSNSVSASIFLTDGTLIKLKENLEVHFKSPLDAEVSNLELKTPEKCEDPVETGSILSKMLKHLEDRVQEQSQVIKHLISQEKEKSEVKKSLPSSSSSNLAPKKQERLKSSSNAPSTSGNTANPTVDKEEFINVKNKNDSNGVIPNKNTKWGALRTTIIKGTAKSEEQDEFQATAKKAWLYIGRAHPSTSEEKLNNYLKKKFPQKMFEVEEIKKHESNTNKNKSFKVNFDFGLLEAVMKPEVWPQNLIVRKYTFRRQGRESEL
ncbi:unnamed protein product [Brassicogethes aeneus]|uniref:Transposable element P transposase n=1 Tax=Brassicogethes aeneus TaxID=1431903 RepID=A0A9P0FFB6_BRAAE|nr:unnamed protein product [Brassicogethes aeneus]